MQNTSSSLIIVLLCAPRQALHAKELGFIHPSTKEAMLFISDTPDDMSAVIEKWRDYSNIKN